MTLQFLRGNQQTPKGHAILVARSTADSRTVLCTYCVVPPMPLSLAKYLPSFLAAQLSPEELQDTTNVPVMPIPPMLEEGNSLEQLQMLADYRDDDLCDLGTINPRDEAARMQLVAQGCQEYGQLYMDHAKSFKQATPTLPPMEDEPLPMDDLDAEELLIQTMTDRQRLAELSKLVGVIRYALDGKDAHLVQETRQRMQRIARKLAEKYRTTELITAAANPQERGARLAELYIERGYKLLDEEYADIPGIERAIRDLQE
ncbi:MAG TPA: hypothetical protein VFV38_10840 [Ktedonobacteraceae bacterium]|nr:hypothetical protein [Ktedonobacteraceae bacterium]